MEMPKTEPVIPSRSLVKIIKSQRVEPSSSKPSKTFYRNLEEALDLRRESHILYCIVEKCWQKDKSIINFCNNDILSFNSGPEFRDAFLAELAQHPDFQPGAGGNRLTDGNYQYLEQTEEEIAKFHGYEAGLIINSGYDANIAIWTSLPRSGDVLVYDELVHCSTHDGMNQSLAVKKIEFLHNDVESFRQVLLSVASSQPQIKQGRRSILVAVESTYSMTGDVCPLRELVEVARDVFPPNLGNVQFIVDEAHSTGMIGPSGSGFVRYLGVEKEIAAVVHSFAKALGSAGAIIVGNKSVVTALVNFPNCFVYTTAPTFPTIATIKAGYSLLQSQKGKEARDHIQMLAQTFWECLTVHPDWEQSQSKGILSIPLAKDWEDRPYLMHIVAVHTQPRYIYWLYFHLLSLSYSTFAVEYPVVPVNESRLRITFHASNTSAQVHGLIEAIFTWVREMIEIQEGRTEKKVSFAARQLYQWMEQEGLTGFGFQPSVSTDV